VQQQFAEEQEAETEQQHACRAIRRCSVSGLPPISPRWGGNSPPMSLDEHGVEKERISHITANRMMLKYFGRAEEDFPSAIVADEVAIFEDY
jgi:hypothetical protein